MRMLSFVVLSLSFASPAIADENHATQAEIEAFVAKAPAYKKSGAPFSGRFDAPPSTSLKVKKGTCYAFVVRLGGDGKFKDGGPMLQFDHWPDDGKNVPMSVGTDLSGPTGAVMVPSCPSEDDEVSFGLAKWTGAGSYTVQVFERKGGSKELSAQAQKTHAFRASEARDKSERHRKQCNQCASEFVGARERRVCVERVGLTLGDCGW